MLAQNFKSAEELGMSDTMYKTLIRVLGMLERQEIPAELFTMRDIGAPDCGTPGCILGWMAAIDKTISVIGPTIMQMPLFFPGTSVWDEGVAYNANRAQAAAAIRSFLRTGEPNWKEAMKYEQKGT